MIQFKHTITDPNGLHARNALLLSREISGYTSGVEVQLLLQESANLLKSTRRIRRREKEEQQK